VTVVVTEPSAFVTLVWLTIVVDDELLLADEEPDEPPPTLPAPDLAEPAVLPLEPAALVCCVEAPEAVVPEASVCDVFVV
jgi:hypothetical protein